MPLPFNTEFPPGPSQKGYTAGMTFILAVPYVPFPCLEKEWVGLVIVSWLVENVDASVL